jgi:putative hydrolase of the HAD superfamily
LRFPFVLLDVGDTLIGPREPFGATYARVLREHGVVVDTARVEEGLRATWDEMNRIVPVGADRYGWFPGGEAAYWLRFVEGTLRRTPGVPDGEGLARRSLDDLRHAFRDPAAWEIFDDVVPTLEALRAAGAKLAVVSNWDSRLPRLLQDLGLARFFDAIVVSHLEGIEKPSPALFDRALARLGADPARALHVGDVPSLDQDGARAAGVPCVLVDRRGRLADGALHDLSPLVRIATEGMPGS